MSLRFPLLLLIVLYAAFLFYVWHSSAALPPRLATHFDATGTPDGWMNRSSHLAFIVVFGSAVPLIVVAIFYAIRFMPANLVNIPQRDFWLAPDQRAATAAYLFRHGLCLASLMIVFVAALHHVVVQANRQMPPRISNELVLALLGGFISGIGVWSIALWRRFSRKSTEGCRH